MKVERSPGEELVNGGDGDVGSIPGIGNATAAIATTARHTRWTNRAKVGRLLGFKKNKIIIPQPAQEHNFLFGRRGRHDRRRRCADRSTSTLSCLLLGGSDVLTAGGRQGFTFHPPRTTSSHNFLPPTVLPW